MLSPGASSNLHGTLGLHLEHLGGGLAFHLCICHIDVSVLLGASLLYVAQASIDLDKVLLHLIEALVEVGGEGLEPFLQLHGDGVVAHGCDLASYTRCHSFALGVGCGCCCPCLEATT